MKALVLSLALLLACITSSYSQSTARRYFDNQMADSHRAVTNPTTNQRVYTIWNQLVNYTGRMYPVYPSQNFTAGQALPNGAILLDISIAGNMSMDVTAFWLAHEYAHQILGHPQLLTSNFGRYIIAVSHAVDPTGMEDAADRWAGNFLKAYNYDINPVTDFLCSIPNTGDRIHSAGAIRAITISKAFGVNFYGCNTRNVAPVTNSRIIQCQHLVHSNGDLSPCSHGVLHTGDRTNCTHTWIAPDGYIRAQHQYDIIPCRHPIHPNGDITPCVHYMHQNGDVVTY